jgi:pilus assembly protein Flp/PilA
MIVRSTIARILSYVHRDDEDGQGLAEYALILALIAVVAIAALLFMGSQVSNKLSIIGSTLQSVGG